MLFYKCKATLYAVETVLNSDKLLKSPDMCLGGGGGSKGSSIKEYFSHKINNAPTHFKHILKIPSKTNCSIVPAISFFSIALLLLIYYKVN